jgi:hypothetical protein
MDVTLSLDSLNKVYYAGDFIQGSVLIINKSKSTMKFDLLVKVVGYYTLRNTKENPPKMKGVQFYKKSFKVLSEQYSTIGANNSYRFKYPLTSDGCEQNLSSLYESYHGVSVSVGYEISAQAVSLGKEFESKKQKILVLVPGQGINSKFGRKRVSYQFKLNPKNIESIKLTDQNLMPKFEIECFLENINCCVDKPFNGFCNIKECSTQIKSLELQFLRNEKILNKEFEGIAEVSEIQNLQIGDGDVIRNLEIPVFMTFPRGFCCANLETQDVCISFEMNLIIVLVNGVVIMENYPVNLWRG